MVGVNYVKNLKYTNIADWLLAVTIVYLTEYLLKVTSLAQDF